MVRRTAAILAAGSVALSAGCGGTDESPTGGGGVQLTCPIPSHVPSPTFQRDILPALQTSCGSLASSCHGTAAPRGHVQYGTPPGRTASDVHAALVNVPPSNAPPGAGWLRVAPGDVAHSWIVEKVTKDQPGGTGYGARMPYAAANLCQATIDTLVSWIQQGAPL
jgi:hypothetical protein